MNDWTDEKIIEPMNNRAEKHPWFPLQFSVVALVVSLSGGNNIINATGDDAVKAFKELEKAGVVGSGSYGSGGGSLVLIGDDTTTERILANY